ncbi:LANO_0B04764g1_1 [Lachancea nothofagi CBS 11611]|uniref:LANO_0B04764g1_1 n=1 Tax=Lachancea nothofagi CBS 11611 TaxID=1266666 RepID=A0A1G4IXW9_9SACH|nr:LANO_0B04764g1_1 [Lachancea nothofagi CBS 11611]
MMRRTSSEQSQSQLQSRRLSSNNPFRVEAAAQQQQVYQSDKEFQEWVSSNAMHSPYGSRPHHSTSLLSFTDSIEEEPHEEALNSPRNPAAQDRAINRSFNTNYLHLSMTPPQRPASKNPFLEDLTPQSETDDDSSSAQTSTIGHPTAQEEKERLRRRYLEQTNVADPPPANDLPPSYDEVAGPKKDSARPREKSSSTSTSSRYKESSTSRSHRHRHREPSERSTRRSSRETGSNQHHSSSHRKSSKDKKQSSSSKPLAKNVDTIDKLDVTGLFGGAFHHDGPFDACTPHRNRNTKVAPVMAFPADGPNSSIAGAANSKSPMKEVFGQESVDDDDAYLYRNKVFNKVNNSSTNTLDAIKPNARTVTQFDAKAKTELVHGPTTDGLGSTTFLDGAPATGAKITHNHNRLHPNYNNDPYRQEPIQLTKTHSGHLEYDNAEPDEDVYLVGRLDPTAKKSSSGNKFMRRVKSLKVGRKP